VRKIANFEVNFALMLGAIKGIYKNGQVILEETPETEGPVEVLVTFTGALKQQYKNPAKDIASRMDELALLQDGWLNGEGLAPKKEDLALFLIMFEQFYDAFLPLPHLYPTPAGGLQAEWANGSSDISLTVDFTAQKAFYQFLNHTSGRVEEFDINLADKAGWQLLNTRLLHTLKDLPNE
jgi:hypothetical protein